jgi:hypothetical protein
MSLQLFFIGAVACVIGACAGQSPSNCYGRGQPGCEAYWESKRKLVTIQPSLDENTKKLFEQYPDLPKYIVRLKVHNWVKIGESSLSTEKALLECGTSQYRGKSITSLEHTDEIVKIEKCMLRDGFTYIGEYKEFDLCSLRTESSTCKPNASIPLRTSTTRIDSLYCIEHAYLRECEPQSFERRQATSHCKKYPEQDICHQSNLPLTCDRYPKAKFCQPYGKTDMSQKEYEGVNNDIPLVSKENAKNTTDSDHGRLLEVLFPAFFNDRPIDPESQKYLIKELEQQRFQKNLQNDNNRDMKNLLRNTAPKAGR